MPYRASGHGPKSGRGTEDSTLLIDATLKHPAPPLALPAREFMERARAIWEELLLPTLSPRPPWHGYSLGDWSEAWDCSAPRRGRAMGDERPGNLCAPPRRRDAGNPGEEREGVMRRQPKSRPRRLMPRR